MRRLAIRKSDKVIVSFGYEDMARFGPDEFDIIDTVLEVLPDDMRFCFYKQGKVVVDQALKDETLQKETKARQEREEARGHLTLEDLAGLTNAQINNWVDSNVTDLVGGRLAIKKLAKWCRALTRIAMLRQDN